VDFVEALVNPRRQILVVGSLALLLLAAALWLALHATALSSGQADTRALRDQAEHVVQVPAHPQRILSLCTTATDTVVTLGAGEHLVAVDEYSRIIPGAQNAVVVGKGGALSREAVSSLRIDLAFIWWYQDDAAALLTDLAIPVVRLRSGRASELPATIRLIGACLNAPGTAEPLASKVGTFLGNATRSASAPQVFLELNGPFKTMGSDTYSNDLLELAGLRNIAGDTKGSVLLSAERLTQADPDAILVVGTSDDLHALAQRPGLSTLRAVRQKQVFALDRYWLVAGPNLPESVAHIRAAMAASSTLSTASKE
jgi:iron complex transport system substrate-binding protein